MLKGMEFLTAVENRESFFKRIALIFPVSDWRYKKIEDAYQTAKDEFRGIYRTGGDRYFEHLRAVALILIVYLRVKDHELIIAALLHDLVEDTHWTIERVKDKFGDKVATLVDWLTKLEGEEVGSKELALHVYHERFNRAPREFFIIKLADRLHNVITLWDCTPEKIIRKVTETKIYYLPFAEKHIILIHELEEAMDVYKVNDLQKMCL